MRVEIVTRFKKLIFPYINRYPSDDRYYVMSPGEGIRSLEFIPVSLMLVREEKCVLIFEKFKDYSLKSKHIYLPLSEPKPLELFISG
jgi:hypothetical protein